MTFEHLDAVLAEVETLGRRFVDAGYRLFLVGGIVRDQWLDGSLDASSDIDLTTDALPAEIKRLVSPIADDMWTQGERFGTIGLRAGGRDYEITTHRAENYDSESRKPQVSFGDDIEVDLSRRDFTVNAMAIELPAGDLVDPYQGADDLAASILRTPLSAEISFTDDPLRMLRAARFATKYALDPVDELRDSAFHLHGRLEIVAIERIGIELRRLLELPQAAHGVDFLGSTGLLSEVLNYGLASNERPLGIEQIQAAVTVVGRLSDDEVTWHQRLAGIGLVTYHDAKGVYEMCRRLRLARDDERAIVRMSEAAVAVLAAEDTDAPTLRRWITACEQPADAIELANAIDPGTNTAAFGRAVDELLKHEDVRGASLLDGQAIMRALSVEPGPAIGRARDYLQSCYFERGPLTEAEQLDLLANWNDG